MKSDRVVVMSSKVSRREAEIIERAAKADGVTVSDYLRTAVLTSAVLDGNLDAMKYTGGLILQKLAKKLEGLDPRGELVVREAGRREVGP